MNVAGFMKCRGYFSTGFAFFLPLFFLSLFFFCLVLLLVFFLVSRNILPFNFHFNPHMATTELLFQQQICTTNEFPIGQHRRVNFSVIVLFFLFIWNKKIKTKELKSLNDTEELLCFSDHRQHQEPRRPFAGSIPAPARISQLKHTQI